MFILVLATGAFLSAADPEPFRAVPVRDPVEFCTAFGDFGQAVSRGRDEGRPAHAFYRIVRDEMDPGLQPLGYGLIDMIYDSDVAPAVAKLSIMSLCLVALIPD